MRTFERATRPQCGTSSPFNSLWIENSCTHLVGIHQPQHGLQVAAAHHLQDVVQRIQDPVLVVSVPGRQRHRKDDSIQAGRRHVVKVGLPVELGACFGPRPVLHPRDGQEEAGQRRGADRIVAVGRLEQLFFDGGTLQRGEAVQVARVRLVRRVGRAGVHGPVELLQQVDRLRPGDVPVRQLLLCVAG